MPSGEDRVRPSKRPVVVLKKQTDHSHVTSGTSVLGSSGLIGAFSQQASQLLSGNYSTVVIVAALLVVVGVVGLYEVAKTELKGHTSFAW